MLLLVFLFLLVLFLLLFVSGLAADYFSQVSQFYQLNPTSERSNPHDFNDIS